MGVSRSDHLPPDGVADIPLGGNRPHDHAPSFVVTNTHDLAVGPPTGADDLVPLLREFIRYPGWDARLGNDAARIAYARIKR